MCEAGASCKTVLATTLGWTGDSEFGSRSTAEQVTEGLNLVSATPLSDTPRPEP
jgi:hypothetical protein